MAGDFERRLLEVERRLGNAGLGLERTRLLTLQGLQQARELWAGLAAAAPGCSSSTRIGGTITGCTGHVRPGTVVTATLGSYSATGTANGSGVYLIDVAGGGAGTYTVTAADADPRFGTPAAQSATLACGGSATRNFVLPPAAGYTCGDTSCAVPTTAPDWTLTTPFGNVAIHSNFSSSAQTIATALKTYKGNCGLSGNCLAAGTAGGNYRIGWHWTGTALVASYGVCAFGGVTYVLDSGSALVNCGGSRSLTITPTSHSCPPAFLYTATVNDPSGLTDWNGQTVSLAE